MSLGLKRGTVRLEPHDPAWEESAKRVMDRLWSILGDDVRDIQHVGSTAIRNVVAKPIVDIVVGVDDFDRMRKHDPELDREGFLFRGQDVERQILYVLGEPESDIRTHHIHVVIWGGQHWKDYLLFRDYLNADPEMAARYSRLKEELCGKYAEDRGTYTQSKKPLIDEIFARARAWDEQRADS